MRDRDRALLLLLLAATAATDADPDHRSGILTRVASRATGAMVDIVDPDAIIDRVDVNALLDRVDVDALLDRVDVNALLDRVDVNALMDRVDVEAIVDRIDVKDLVDRAGISDIVRESTGEFAGSAVDVARRQLVALDEIIGRTLYGLTGRDAAARPQAPPDLEAGVGVDEQGRGQVTGHYAGPASRFLAFLADWLAAWGVFVLMAAGLAFAVEFFSGADLSDTWTSSLVGGALLVLWYLTYMAGGLALAGRTFGMGVIGLRVVTRQGKPISGRQALIRTLVFPFSLLFFGLGFLGILFSPERRSLHDAAAGTVVVYDWGDRPAEMPAPLTNWINRRTEEE